MKAIAAVLAVIFLVVAVIFLLPAGPLGHHVKHAVLFLVLAAISLVWLRFQTRSASLASRR